MQPVVQHFVYQRSSFIHSSIHHSTFICIELNDCCSVAGGVRDNERSGRDNQLCIVRIVTEPRTLLDNIRFDESHTLFLCCRGENMNLRRFVFTLKQCIVYEALFTTTCRSIANKTTVSKTQTTGEIQIREFSTVDS